jgi:hypothetical protein
MRDKEGYREQERQQMQRKVAHWEMADYFFIVDIS